MFLEFLSLTVVVIIAMISATWMLANKIAEKHEKASQERETMRLSIERELTRMNKRIKSKIDNHEKRIVILEKVSEKIEKDKKKSKGD